mgnify:FL=1
MSLGRGGGAAPLRREPQRQGGSRAAACGGVPPSGSEGHVPYEVRYNMLYLTLRKASSCKVFGGWNVAHIAKYKATAVGKLCAHYNRWDSIDNPAVQRENIDKKRTHLNYTLGVYEEDGHRYIGKVRGTASWATVKGRIDSVNEAAKAAGKRATRSDAVVMADMVVTLPKNVPHKDAFKFFCASYQYIGDRVGRQNLMGGYVHMDETTPHMHVPFTPILDGRFNYKKMCDRRFYQTFHKGLGDHLEKKMGYRPEVELSEDKKAERALSQVRMEDLDAARAAITASAEERLAEVNEELGAAERELQRRRDDITFAERELDAAVGRQLDAEERMAVEVERLECLRQANDGIEQRVAELESIVADARGYASENRAGKVALISRIADAADRCASEINRGIAGVRQMIARLRERAVTTTYTWNLVGGVLRAEENRVASNRVEKKFDLFSNRERNAEPSRASQDRRRVSELSRAAASWDENRSSSRGRGR